MAHSREYIRFARAALLHFAEIGRITWREYNWLIRDVIWNELRLYGCEGREVFNTFEQAQAVASRKSRDGHVHRKAYRCRICGGAHITTIQPERRRAAKRQKERLRERALADA